MRSTGPGPSAKPGGSGPSASLVAALDAQVQVLEAMVLASQRQISAILAYRADLRQTEPDELARAQADLGRGAAALGPINEAVRGAVDAILPGATPSAAAARLPLPERRAVEERISLVRSLAQSMNELQRVTQFHAQRGLQVLRAWRSLVEPTQSANTYSHPRTARRVQRRTDVTSRVLEVDL